MADDGANSATDTDTRTESESDNGQGGNENGGRTFSQSEVDALIRERLNRERSKYADYSDLKSKADKFEELERERMTETERAKAEAEDARKRANEALESLKGERLRNAVYGSAVKLGAVDPDAVLALLDRSTLLDEEGKPANVDDAITALLASKPYLKAGPRKPSGDIDGGARGATGTTTFSRSQLKDPDFFSKNKSEIFKAMAEGRITED